MQKLSFQKKSKRMNEQATFKLPEKTNTQDVDCGPTQHKPDLLGSREMRANAIFGVIKATLEAKTQAGYAIVSCQIFHLSGVVILDDSQEQ